MSITAATELRIHAVEPSIMLICIKIIFNDSTFVIFPPFPLQCHCPLEGQEGGPYVKSPFNPAPFPDAYCSSGTATLKMENCRMSRAC